MSADPGAGQTSVLGTWRLVPVGHFHGFMALAVEWQLFAPTWQFVM
jgi:hypothetical protein